jgi:hypothetical protein
VAGNPTAAWILDRTAEQKQTNQLTPGFGNCIMFIIEFVNFETTCFPRKSEIQVIGGSFMQVDTQIGCQDFPCLDVRHECYLIPDIDIDPTQISLVLISEAVPVDPQEYYYTQGASLYQQMTLHAFREAGAHISSFQEILGMGIYLTTAVKCAKTGYGIKAETVRNCSHILEREIDLFPNVSAYLLMGDVAIKSANMIAKRLGQGRAIPAGSTYKIRISEYTFRGARAFPSYLQVGPSYGIEKSKQRMIAEDIAAALSLIAHHHPDS